MRYLCTPALTLAMLSGLVDAATITVPTDQPTIQAAIDAAVDGDLVLVQPGTYVELNIVFQGKAITLRGSTDADGLPTTTVTSEGQGRVMSFTFTEVEDTIIENLTITESGGSESAVGVFSGSPTFLNCTFLENTGNIGGGLYNLNGAPRFTDCRFIGNTATWGGGYACWETGQPNHPVFTRCLFDGNTAKLGGAFANLRSQPTLTECTFTNNTSTGNGAAFYNDGDDCCPHWEGNPVLVDCLFDGNASAESGGAIYNSMFGFPQLENCILQNNSAVMLGSAMASETAMFPTLIGNTICSNTGTPTQISGPWNDDGGNAIEDTCPADCIGDLDGSGTVDVNDLLTLLSGYLLNSDGDCDGDGDTDVNDLLLLIDRWGVCP